MTAPAKRPLATDKNQSPKADEEAWVKFWFVNGGGIHRAAKFEDFDEMEKLARALPRAAWDAAIAHARQSPDSRGNLINRNESNKDIPETKASAPQVEAQGEKWPPIGYRQRLKSCKQRFDEKWQFDQKSGSGIGSAQETQVDMGCSILKEKRTEHTAALSAARAEGWNEAVKQFRIHGTDGCRTCATGRVTLFIANDQCTQCNPKSYERKAIAAPPEGQATEGEGT